MVPDGTADGVIVKLTRVGAGIDSLRRAADVQRRLHADPALATWRRLVPEVVADGTLERWSYMTERRLPGRSIDPAAGGTVGRALANALEAIGDLHRSTLAPVDVGVARVAWVDHPLERVAAILTGGPPTSLVAAAVAERVARVGAELRPAIDAVETGGWIHGDLWSANVLVDPAGKVTGFVDWDSAGPAELPDHDILHLVLYARKVRERRPLGRVLVQVLTDGWSPVDEALLAAAPASALAMRPALMLYWLRFVEVNLRRHPGLAVSPAWLEHNVAAVLACL